MAGLDPAICRAPGRRVKPGDDAENVRIWSD